MIGLADTTEYGAAALLYHMGEFMCQQFAARTRVRSITFPAEEYIGAHRESAGVDNTTLAKMQSHIAEIEAEVPTHPCSRSFVQTLARPAVLNARSPLECRMIEIFRHN
jgi:hypothetical protein